MFRLGSHLPIRQRLSSISCQHISKRLMSTETTSSTQIQSKSTKIYDKIGEGCIFVGGVSGLMFGAIDGKTLPTKIIGSMAYGCVGAIGGGLVALVSPLILVSLPFVGGSYLYDRYQIKNKTDINDDSYGD